MNTILSSLLSSLPRCVYTTIYFFLLPFIFLRLLWRSLKAPDYRKRIPERLGFFSAPVFTQRPIVIHAVSVGENVAVLPVVRALLEKNPEIPLVLTSSTPTGSAQIRRSLKREIQAGRVFHVYLPYDLPFFLNQFFNKLQPRLMLMVETELWPNALALSKKRNIKTALINARLSEKSYRSYSKLTRMVDEMLCHLDLIVAQDESSAARFVKLGMQEESVKVSGNVKFDLSLDEEVNKKSLQLKALLQKSSELSEKRKIFIAGSTHAGEDEIILEAYSLLLALLEKDQEKINAPLLVLAPRHPERFSDVKKLSETQNFKTQLLSKLNRNDAWAEKEVFDVLVADEMGMLLALYGASDVAFVGGSLLQVGGHNMLEPAAWAVPIISGENVFNFQAVADQLHENKALVYVTDAQSLADCWFQFLSDDELSEQAGRAAKNYQQANQGAVENTLEALEGLI